jgi:hypothetical protein
MWYGSVWAWFSHQQLTVIFIQAAEEAITRDEAENLD